MVLNELKSCVTILSGEINFDNKAFPIREITLDGDEMPTSDERISCMICTLEDINEY